VTRRNSSSHHLTGLQQAILDFLSSKQAATADQVRAGLKPRFPLSDSSVRTLLRRLESRGLVSHTTEGKVFVYRAEMPSTRVAANAVKRLIQGFWAGSTERFLAGLVDEEIVSAEELARLSRKVRRARGRQ
jgi:predicted transcriptional regulator